MVQPEGAVAEAEQAEEEAMVEGPEVREVLEGLGLQGVKEELLDLEVVVEQAVLALKVGPVVEARVVTVSKGEDGVALENLVGTEGGRIEVEREATEVELVA